MNANGMLKIIFKRWGRPLQMYIVIPSTAKVDEFTVLFQILNRFEIRKGINIEFNAAEAKQLRPRVAALGITDVAWESVVVSRDERDPAMRQKLSIQSMVHPA